MKIRMRNDDRRFGVTGRIGACLSALTLVALLAAPSDGQGGYVEAAGGDSTYMIVEDGTAYWVHQFVNTAEEGTTLAITQGGEVECLIVGGLYAPYLGGNATQMVQFNNVNWVCS